MKWNSVYVDRAQGGWTFGLDSVTPVTWTFSRRKLAPRSSYRRFGLANANPSAVNAMPQTWYGSYNQLREALRPENLTPSAVTL